jgi:hypothetical protein
VNGRTKEKQIQIGLDVLMVSQKHLFEVKRRNQFDRITNVSKVSTGFEFFPLGFVQALVLVALMVVLDAELNSASNGITFRPGHRPSKGASLEKPLLWDPLDGFSLWDSPKHLCWLCWMQN